MRRRCVLFAAVALTVAIGGGCSTLPTSGEPHEFAIEVPTREPIGQFGSGPQPGSSPTILIEDFLRACAAGSFDDYATARRYLMSEASDNWRPNQQVTIFPTDHAPRASVDSQTESLAEVHFDVPTIATVDEFGSMVELPEPATTSVTFGLEKNEEGEWRISNLDDGLVLSSSSFTTGFSSYNVYFASIDGEALVADPRWIPRLRVSSHLVNALLQGPTPAIAPAVHGDLGEGLSLPTAGVDVRDRVAYVELEGPLLTESTPRQLFYWELVQTLRQAPNVQNVVVRINSAELSPQNSPTGPEYATDRLVAVEDGGISMGTLGAMTTIIAPSALSAEPQFPSIGPLTQGPLAWIDADGGMLRVQRPGAAEIQSFEVPSATKPSVDRRGNIWTTGGSGQRTLLFVDDRGQLEPVRTGLPRAPISRVAVSPDGARIAMAIGQGKEATLWLATLAPGGDSGFEVVNPAPVDRVPKGVLDMSWSGPTSILALTKSPGEDALIVRTVWIGGWSTTVPAPEGAVWVSGGAPSLGVIVQREDQTAFRRSGSAWLDQGNQLKYLSSSG